ncbi:MAG: rhomboid family intramembrane serine protease [Capsulimonadaceae bacterium]
MSVWQILLLLFAMVLVLPIPVQTDQVIRRRPWVTYGLIAINALVYLLTIPYLAPGSPSVYDRWGVVPDDVHATTLLTSMFVHVWIGHLLLNMLFLWVFGPPVENAIGSATFAVLYLGGGVSAAVLHCAIVDVCASHSSAFVPQLANPLVGASGAISAILAPFVVRYHRSKLRLVWIPGYVVGSSWGYLELPAITGLALWLLINVSYGIRGIIWPDSGDVAYWAHLGGFAFGFVVSVLTGMFREGWTEYLLQDARASVGRGSSGLRDAIRQYRGYLQFEPDDIAVRLEFVDVMADMARIDHDKTLADRAEQEMAGAIRRLLESRNASGAVAIGAHGLARGIPLRLNPRERLRLAGVAQDIGDTTTAVALLEALVHDTPEAAEDEIARLKLGQLLAPIDPRRSARFLGTLIARYPRGHWVAMASELLARAETVGRRTDDKRPDESPRRER